MVDEKLFNNLPPLDPNQEDDLPPDDGEISPLQRPDELSMLKQRATLMGLSYSPNIGLETLRARVKAKMEGEAQSEPEPEETGSPFVAPTSNTTSNMPVTMRTVSKAEQAQIDRQKMFDEQMRLVRVRITNMDPKKKDLNGEIFTVANRVLGAVKRYIPYGEKTDDGWHIPWVIYEQLRERQFLDISTKKDARGRTYQETKMIREFALEILPPLTQQELDKLAAVQAAAGGME